MKFSIATLVVIAGAALVQAAPAPSPFEPIRDLDTVRANFKSEIETLQAAKGTQKRDVLKRCDWSCFDDCTEICYQNTGADPTGGDLYAGGCVLSCGSICGGC